jgi:hypothetical protein
MQKNRITLIAIVLVAIVTVTACGIEKISKKKTNDVDFTVVAENEIPEEVNRIVEERKEEPFKVTYSDNEYTYIIVGYGKQNYDGYSISVKEMYETKNAVCVKTEFQGPVEYTNTQVETFPYIVIKIEYTDKNVVFCE